MKPVPTLRCRKFAHGEGFSKAAFSHETARAAFSGRALGQTAMLSCPERRLSGQKVRKLPLGIQLRERKQLRV